jgi:uncharacterized protein
MNRETIDLEFKFDAGDAGELSGIASVFGEADAYGDTIAPGAFAKSLSEHKAAGTRPLFFFNHNTDEIIGIWDEIRETAAGLEVKGRIVTETQRGREAHALLKAGALNGLSIGFRTRAAKNGNGGRTLTEIDLVEISLVPLPAAKRARIHTVKSDVAARDDESIQAFARAVANAITTVKATR